MAEVKSCFAKRIPPKYRNDISGKIKYGLEIPELIIASIKSPRKDFLQKQGFPAVFLRLSDESYNAVDFSCEIWYSNNEHLFKHTEKELEICRLGSSEAERPA